MCSKQAGVAIYFIKLLLKYEKYVFKTSGRLLFSLIKLSSLSYLCNTKNMCSKQEGNCFLVHSVTFVNKTCVFKSSGRLLFSLFGYFCNTKHVCSKQEGGCFFSLLMINKYYTTKMFLLRIL